MLIQIFQPKAELFGFRSMLKTITAQFLKANINWICETSDGNVLAEMLNDARKEEIFSMAFQHVVYEKSRMNMGTETLLKKVFPYHNMSDIRHMIQKKKTNQCVIMERHGDTKYAEKLN